MQLAMDVRLASTAARFGFVFTRRGVVMEACSSWFLTRLVGMWQAQGWVLTGRVFDAEAALKGDLDGSIHSLDVLMRAGRALAREIADTTTAAPVAMCRPMLLKYSGPSPTTKTQK